MESQGQNDIYHQVNNILDEPTAPLEKVQRLVNLGYEEEEADLLVERYQSGQAQPIFYEELPKAEYADQVDENPKR